MTAALVGMLVVAAWLAFSPAGGSSRRLRLRLETSPISPGLRPDRAAGRGPNHRPGRGTGTDSGRQTVLGRHGLVLRRKFAFVPMAVFVQQSAALLQGGRASAQLWDELWRLHGGEPAPGVPLPPGSVAAISPVSRAALSAAHAAASRGAPVGEAIRKAATGRSAGARAAPRSGDPAREVRAWVEFAACFDVAEASGCPLAGVLARFAAQLEAEDDAEAARQTALAGPRATVRLLTWLPILGLGLGVLLGVDPIKILLAEPAGLAALAVGAVLTAAGRIWSAKLVQSASGLPR